MIHFVLGRFNSAAKELVFIWLLTFFMLMVGSAELVCAAPETEPLRFAVTDVQGLEELQREFSAFQKILREKSGLNIELFPVTSRTVAVEALKRKKLDFALTGPAEYVLIRQRTNAMPVAGLARPDYFSVIAVKADSDINSLSDLKGKSIAFGDIGSTAYHLSPNYMLMEAGVDSDKDLKKIHVSKQVGWKSFVRGDVDAIGMNRERYETYRDQETRVKPEDFKVIATSQKLPDDLILAGGHVNQEVIRKMQYAFGTFGDELLKAILVGERNQKYQGMHFYTDIKDSKYDYVRQMYAVAGFPGFEAYHLKKVS